MLMLDRNPFLVEEIFQSGMGPSLHHTKVQYTTLVLYFIKDDTRYLSLWARFVHQGIYGHHIYVAKHGSTGYGCQSCSRSTEQGKCFPPPRPSLRLRIGLARQRRVQPSLYEAGSLRGTCKKTLIPLLAVLADVRCPMRVTLQTFCIFSHSRGE